MPRATGSTGSPPKPSFATFPQVKIRLNLPIGFDVPPPVGAGGVTEAVKGLCLSPIADVAPSRRAVGPAAGDLRGWEFPMAMGGTVKFFNAERGYGFIKP